MNRNFILSRLGLPLWLILLFTGAVVQHSQAQTYCTPTYNFGCADDYIQSFSTSGGSTNISNLNSGASTAVGCLSNQTAMMHSAQANSTVNFTIQNCPGWTEGYKIFVDWNEDGDFLDLNEVVYDPSAALAAGGSVSSSFVIPVGTIPGNKRMRVRCVFNTTNFDACGNEDFGEAEDYTMTVLPSAPCTNPPDPGVIASSVPDSICPNIAFTLATTGTSLGTGMTYQWEQSPSGLAGTWANVPGGASFNYMMPGITATTFFRLKSICSGGTPVYSNAKEVLLKSFINCYCTPGYNFGCANGGTINSFSTTGAITDVSNLNTGCASGNAGYSDYSTMSIEAAQTFGFNFTVQITAFGSGVKIWADWNHDGIFDPSTELCAASANVIPAGSTFSGTITPPATAVLGSTRFRVRAVEGSTTFDPCGMADWGETEDYTINIVIPPACTTVTFPTNVVATASPASLCVSGDADLSINMMMPPATGITYQWQSSPDGTTGWTNLGTAGVSSDMTATGISATTYYRLQVLCDGSPVVTSAIDTVVVSNPGSVTAVDGERCGEGSVTIGANTTGAGSNVLWYEGPTGGLSIASGAVFNTPVLNTTTTFYAAAAAGASQYTMGKTSPTSTTGNNGFSDVGLMFDATTPFVLESVDVYPTGTTGTGTLTIALKDATGTVLQSTTATVNVSSAGTLNTVPLNFSVPAGNGYRLVANGASGITTLIRESGSGYVYPYTVSGVCSITSAYTGGASNAYYYYFYNWVIKIGCESARVPVVATINPLPEPDLGPDIDTCIDQGKLISLDPGVIPYNPSYQWDDGTTAASRSVGQTGIYEVAVTNQYGCTARDTIEVTMRWNPLVNLAAGGTGLCLGATKTLDAGPGGLNGGSYYWNTGATTRTILVDNPGSYIAYVTSNEGCLTIDTVDIVGSGNMPTNDGIETLPLSVSSFKFSVIDPQNVTEFVWDFGDGTPPVTIPATSSAVGLTDHQFSYGGNYTVTLTTYSICGAIQDSTLVSIVGLGVDDMDQEANSVLVYPNPNNGTMLFIQTDEGVQVERMVIYNALGQEVVTMPAWVNAATLQKVALPKQLASGMYTLQVYTNKGVATRKLEIVK